MNTIYNKKIFDYKNKKGFSLIELMVALTIFSIVMTIALGTILIMVDASAKAQAVSSSMTNLTYALDSMTRNIRTGKDFYCPTGAALADLNSNIVDTLHDDPYDEEGADCIGQSALIFTPGFSTTTRLGYRRNATDGTIEQWVDTDADQDGNSDSPTSWVPITSNSDPIGVNVTRLRFVMSGGRHTDDNDYRQPQISLLIEGTTDNGLDIPTEFKVQSFVGQRILDLF